MEELKKLKQLIEKNQNFFLIFSQEKENDAVPAVIAFLYILKQLGKNASIVSPIPKKFNFLLAKEANRAADFLVAVKEQATKITDAFLEKTSLGVNVFLKTSGGVINPEDVTLQNLSQIEPPVYLTFGISHFNELLSYFKTPPDTLINIDTPGANENYGHLNITAEEAPSLSELALDIISFLDENLFSKNVATSLLSGMVCWNQHPPAAPLTGQTLQKIGFLIEQGAAVKIIAEYLCQSEAVDEKSLLIFEKILSKLNFSERRNVGWALLEESVFQEIGATIKNIPFALKRLSSGAFPFENFFLLWEQHNSPTQTRGIFYSPDHQKIDKVAQSLNGAKKGNGVLFQVQALDLQFVKNKILELLELN